MRAKVFYGIVPLVVLIMHSCMSSAVQERVVWPELQRSVVVLSQALAGLDWSGLQAAVVRRSAGGTKEAWARLAPLVGGELDRQVAAGLMGPTGRVLAEGAVHELGVVVGGLR